jgi:hypothetical protein
VAPLLLGFAAALPFGYPAQSAFFVSVLLYNNY